MNIKTLVLSLSLVTSMCMHALSHHEFKAFSEEKKWEAHQALQAEVSKKDELITKYKAEQDKFPYKTVGLSCIGTIVGIVVICSLFGGGESD